MRVAVRTFLRVVVACFFATSAPALAANVETDLHAARAAAAPGETLTIVLRQNIRAGWHTYWRNPGDSGESTKLAWTPVAGGEIGPLQFPPPTRIPFDILVNYGYSGEVLYPISVRVPANARPGERLSLTAHATWLVCSDVCIPEEADIALALPIAAAGVDDATWAPRIRDAVARLPRPASDIAARITRDGENAALITFAGDALSAGRVRDPHFFPYRNDAIDHAAPEGTQFGPRGVSFTLKAGVAHDLGAAPLDGVLTFSARTAEGWAPRAIEVRADPGPPLPGAGGGAAAAPGESSLTLPLALVFALLGGLILNVMPCVFPVLSIKAMSLARHAGDARAARRGGVLFLAGVMTTFLALAGLLIALKSGGAAIGWGFQLQNPALVAGLAALFFAIGLNFAGVFEIGGAMQGWGARLAARGGDAGAFFTGALAVIAATPCTAPFMASATGFAAAQGPVVTLSVFAALGLGFAAPFTVLSVAPSLHRLLPKPGAWMNRAKIVLAFPMFAAAAWLAWVLAAQTGPDGVLRLMAICTALAFLAVAASWGRVWGLAGLAALVLATIVSAPTFSTRETAHVSAEAWSPARVEALRAEGKGVFVNFTAAWCVTCQVNKATTLTSPRVAQAFAAYNVAYLEADWTNRDPAIAQALADYGRDGLPLYLYFAPGAARPRILPQILTPDIVIGALVAQ